MGIISILLIAVGLAMDSLVVSISGGIVMRPFCMRQSLRLALTMGIFQGGMTLLGWLMGVSFSSYITAFDHWIAFILLAVIGVNMIHEALGEDDGDSDDSGDHLDLKELLMLAIATSIDALAVGITFAFLQVNILPAVSLIGIITLAISFAGVHIGHQFGSRYEKKAEIAGGVILILIGLKILLEHLGVF